MGKRRICVVTGGRADYGLLLPMLREIEKVKDLALQLVVSGTHLSAQFGMTVEAIKSDEIPISVQVHMLQEGDDELAISASVAEGIKGFSHAFSELSPDVVVVLGDRFEILAASIAAMIVRIPIAHIHGGEITEGAIDDAIRHSISKMAHIHFVSAKPYRQRLIQLGENPDRIFQVGAPGLDHLKTMGFLERSDLEADLQISLSSPVLLATYHPVTLQDDFAESGMKALCAALEQFPEATVLFTGVNSDQGNRRITCSIHDFARRNPGRVNVFESLGQRRYLSVMKIADAVVGNSSSGIIEAPALGVPTVNIGDRQEGRLRTASIIDCDETVDSISAAISKAMGEGFRDSLSTLSHPYGDGTASRKMVGILQDIDLEGILIKKFYDVGAVT